MSFLALSAVRQPDIPFQTAVIARLDRAIQ
jgi:hypothetical protein